MGKRLVVCCDGTWNRPDQLHNGVAAPTNVAKLSLAVAREDGEGRAQLVNYQPGVGTRRWERLRGGAFGLGLSRNVRECYRFLVERYEPGDELFFFGFSRGAFTARSTVGMVRNCGILRREHIDRIGEAYRLYRGRAEPTKPDGMEAQLFRRMYAHAETDIHFVGVWDTVGALGIPIDGVRLPIVKLWSFHDTRLSRHVRFAYHALAIDEQRGPFQPTLWQQHEEAEGQTLEQVWFAGVHCDVGGGYSEPALAEIPLLWMVGRAKAAGLAFVPDRLVLPDGPLDEQLRHLGIQLAPDALGELHESRKGFYRLFRRYPRPLAAHGASAASSAIRRRDQRSDYDPRELARYLTGGGRETAVEDEAGRDTL
jgi:uncharacterized protein (DUF2235 family)